MNEIALTADHLVVIGKGRLIADGSVRDFIGRSSTNHVRVVTPQADALRRLVEVHGASVTQDGAETLSITGLECREVGVLAANGSITLYELSPQEATLEEAFMEMTRGSVEFHGEAHPAESSVS